MKLTLRNYQNGAVNAILRDYEQPGNSLVILPTGSGKSVVIADAVHKINKNALILQPSKEILEQNANKLRNYVDYREIGIYSASFNKRQIRKFTFATIQSIYKMPEMFEDFGLVLIDECDLMNPKNTQGMFTSFIKAIGNPKTFGFTATPYRNMQAYSTNKYGGYDSALTLKLINRIKPDFWKRIIFNINNKELFDQGYLCPLRYFDRAQFDHRQIPMNKSRTDFDTEKFANNLATFRPTILDLINRAASKMKSVLVFCNSVDEAKAMARQVPNAASVDGKTKKDERDRIIREFREGRIKVVFNMGVLTVGFDHPELDCIFVLRPTRSLRLWYQMIGRGIRIAPGKKECIVVDFTSNVRNLGRIETIRLYQEKKMFDFRKMWYLSSETEEGFTDWHGKQLYSMELKAKPKQRDLEDKENDL